VRGHLLNLNKEMQRHKGKRIRALCTHQKEEVEGSKWSMGATSDEQSLHIGNKRGKVSRSIQRVWRARLPKERTKLVGPTREFTTRRDLALRDGPGGGGKEGGGGGLGGVKVDKRGRGGKG